VLLLTVDCLRADTAAELNSLSKLAASGTDVADCHCTGSGTPTSMPGLMQARLPTDHGGACRVHSLVPGVPTLAETFDAAGFRSGGWHSNVYTSRRFGYHRGFDIFADLKDEPPDHPGDDTADGGADDGGRNLLDLGESVSRRLGLEHEARRALSMLRRLGVVDRRPGVAAEVVVDSLLGWLPDGPTGERHFTWGHLMDLHSPYVPPDAYRRQVSDCPTSDSELWALNDTLRTKPQSLSDAEVQRLKGLYDAAARFVDDQLARLVKELRTRDLWDETVVVVTSDHGEMFDDRPIPDDYAFQHPNYLCDYVTHVPLVFGGGSVANETIERVASGADVAPTLATLAGVEPPDSWNGVVLGGAEHEGRAGVYSVTGRGTRQDHTESSTLPKETVHVSFRTGQEATLWWSDGARDPECYERGSAGLDPAVHETSVPCDETSDTSVDAIAKRFAEVVADRQMEDESNDLDDETTERLRQLGYLE
jgi:arylsulfatase A-like enzyme